MWDYCIKRIDYVKFNNATHTDSQGRAAFALAQFGVEHILAKSANPARRCWRTLCAEEMQPMIKSIFFPIYLLLCLGTVFFTNGCATYNVWESNLKYRDYTTEIDQYDSKSFYIREGVYSGTVSEDDAEWREYLFEGILSGENRAFRILVPTSVNQGMETSDLSSPSEWNGPRVKISETIKQSEALTAARVVFIPHGPFPMEDILLMFQYQLPTFDITEYGTKLLIINDVFSGEDVLYFRNSEFSDNDLSQWIALPTERDIHWKKRNMILASFRKTPYILSVPFDLLTSPIQLLLFSMTWGQ